MCSWASCSSLSTFHPTASYVSRSVLPKISLAPHRRQLNSNFCGQGRRTRTYFFQKNRPAKLHIFPEGLMKHRKSTNDRCAKLHFAAISKVHSLYLWSFLQEFLYAAMWGNIRLPIIVLKQYITTFLFALCMPLVRRLLMCAGHSMRTVRTTNKSFID